MKNYINTGSKDTRSGFGAGMTELGQNETWVALCADLMDQNLTILRKSPRAFFPNRNCRSKHDWYCSRINHWR
jgi:hypothetical protein